MSEIKTLYLDFDGVIVHTIKAVVDLYNEDFQYYKNYHHVNWWEVNTYDFTECNCVNKEYIDVYFGQPRMFQKLELMPWARPVIDVLSEFYNIKIISKGSIPNLRLKAEWVEEYFPYAEFIGLKRHKNKSQIDMADGFFLDDQLDNMQDVNAKDIAIFGDVYPWNEKWEGKRLVNWMDVKNYLLGGK